MNLQAIFPIPPEGLRIQCIACYRMHDARTSSADLDGNAGDFYCQECISKHKGASEKLSKRMEFLEMMKEVLCPKIGRKT